MVRLNFWVCWGVQRPGSLPFVRSHSQSLIGWPQCGVSFPPWDSTNVLRPGRNMLTSANRAGRSKSSAPGAALFLAVVGIYGVLSYSVAQGTQEIGIRMALDAEEGTIAKIVVGQGLALILLSFAIGVLSALATAQVFLSLHYGVTLRDPLT
jgi:hypothetical protein